LTHERGIVRAVMSIGNLGSALLGWGYANRVVLALAGLAVTIAVLLVARRRGWLAAIGRHPGRATAVLVPILAVGLPLGWYLGSPLVLSSSVDEPAPSVGVATSGAPIAVATPMATAGSPDPDDPATRPSRLPATAAPSVRPAFAAAGPFTGSDEFHFGRGTARLIETAPGTYVVRLEDFAVRNGPDLYVYLSPDASGYADDAIELGRLKADTGNQNYRVPEGALANPGRAASVVIWCKQFSHLFATAPLAQVQS
jgi:hypothetical protein